MSKDIDYDNLIKMKICSICFRKFLEYGNNAWPVNLGICCNNCDDNIVIPARISFKVNCDFGEVFTSK